MINSPDAQNLQDGISLEDFLSYNNPNLSHYRDLIKLEEKARSGIRSPQSFADIWRRDFDHPIFTENGKRPPSWKIPGEYFKNKLAGGTLIDLGGGSDSTMRNLADISGVLTYINVDVINGKNLNPFVKHDLKPIDFWRAADEKRPQKMEAIMVLDDMLDFVARLPANSANFCLNGIDINVIRTPEYREALMKEIMRATKLGGIMFGIGTDIWQDDKLKSMGQNLFPDQGYGNRHVVFEKKEG